MSKVKNIALYENQKYSVLASKTAQLIASSARCSRRRLYPLELCVDSRADLAVERPRKKSKVGANAQVATLSNERISEDAEHDMISGVANVDTIMGTGSAQPLRMLQHSRVVHGKNQVFRFVGDKQPSTDIAIANVFNAHPRHKIQNIACDTANVVSAALAVSTTTGEPALDTSAVTQASAPEIVSQQHISASSSGSGRSSIPSNVGIAHTATQPLQHAHEAYRTVFASNDEGAHLAGTDVEQPSAALMGYIRDLASRKVMTALAKKKLTASNTVSSNGQSYKECIQDQLDSTALVAVSVLVEELVRDMMVNWYQKGTPLGFDARNLRTEALAQMNGAPDPKAISVALLQNRLEVLFGRKLDSHTEDIKLFRKIAILGSNSKSGKPRRSSNKEMAEEGVDAPY